MVSYGLCIFRSLVTYNACTITILLYFLANKFTVFAVVNLTLIDLPGLTKVAVGTIQ